jgi:peptide-methionine (R)-S-oxide reductase
MNDLKSKPDAYWKEKLSEEQFQVCRLKGTEVPFSGDYVDHHENGKYVCVACGVELFSSEGKYNSGTGWPSFYEAVNKDNIEFKDDESHGMRRTEVTCKNCGSHLGHIFPDKRTPTEVDYCINSVALKFIPNEH